MKNQNANQNANQNIKTQSEIWERIELYQDQLELAIKKRNAYGKISYLDEFFDDDLGDLESCTPELLDMLILSLVDKLEELLWIINGENPKILH